jgi:hypothetical protein
MYIAWVYLMLVMLLISNKELPLNQTSTSSLPPSDLFDDTKEDFILPQ